MNHDPFLQTYEAQLHYLQTELEQFAERFPEQGALLGINHVGNLNPALKRLTQFAAFGLARMEQELSDDFPEVTEGVLDMLGSHFLHRIPSLCVVEFSQDGPLQPTGEQLEQGTAITSSTSDPEWSRFYYRTTRSVTLYPLTLEKVCSLRDANGHSRIRLRFHAHPKTNWASLDLRALPLYLAGDELLRSTLLQRLATANALWIRFPGQETAQPLPGRLNVIGLEHDDPLWPMPAGQYQDFILLLEYFIFREKFMFVQLTGLDQIAFPEPPDNASEKDCWFEVDIQLQQHWPPDLMLSQHHVRLYCTPAINLFNLDARLLAVPAHQSALRVQISEQDQALTPGCEIYAIHQVTLSTQPHIHFKPFTHFQHQGGLLRYQTPERYYYTRIERGPSGQLDTWLILGGAAFEAAAQQGEQLLRLRLTGTHGHLPRMVLNGLQLDTLVGSQAKVPLKVRNLSQPTLPHSPPNQNRYHWRILSHLGSQFLPMLDSAPVLRETLALYNWSDDPANQRRLNAIVDVKHRLLERIEYGQVRRGAEIHISLDRCGFTGEGDLTLFVQLLNRFFALYADIHLFNRLVVTILPDQQICALPENHCNRVPGA